MNRKSLFGRLANSTTVAKKAERQEYYRVNLEPLEDRKMLAVYYNDDWTDENGGDLEDGDIVSHPTDFGGTATMAGSNLEYGFDAFGKKSGAGTNEFPDIKSAIDAAADDEQVLIGAGTHFQSDIVIDHPLLFEGDGEDVTFIYPATTSAATTGDFPAGTHSGIIIHSDGVAVSGVTLDGNGNTALGGSLNYHHGITTLYDTPGGSTLNNGTLATMVYGPVTSGFPDETSPDLLVTNVTVKNAFWHGITISPLENKTFDVGDSDALQLGIFDSTVDNIGPATKTLDHIGVLMQNIHDSNDDRVGSIGSGAQAAAAGLDFGTNGMSIANVGVGVKTAPFGSLSGGEFGSRSSAHNSAETLGVLVDNATFYGYWIVDADDSNQDLLHASLSGGPIADSVGVFLDHSRGDLAGNTLIDGYDIGLRARNVNSNFTGGAIFIGPGSGTSGSVGIQLDNDSGDRFSGDYESSFLISALTQVSGFETGILSEQGTIHVDPNTLILDRPTISGNATQVSIGDNSVLTGQVDTDDIEINGTGSFRPRMDPDGELFDGSTKPTGGSSANPTPGSLLTTKATTVAAANLTLSSGSTFTTLITGEDASSDVRWDFNTKVGSTGQFPQVFIPPFNYTHSLVDPQTPIGAVLGWGTSLGSGTVIQDGTGELVVDDQDVGNLFNSLYFNDHTTNGSVYLLSPEDHSDRTYINLSMKLGSDNESPLVFFGLSDWRANTRLYTIPTHILNTTTYTTVTLSVNSGTVDIDELTHTENYGSGDQDDLGLDASNISGYVLAGDNGLVYGDTTTPIEFSIADITFTDQKNSTLEVSGTVDLGGATLAGNIRATFDPADDDEFTIINKTSGGSVTGTFNGLGEGASVTLDGQDFTISYTGGDGNDVVLTATSGFSSTVTARRLFYNDSAYDPSAAAEAGDISAEDTSKSAYLPGDGAWTAANSSNYSKGINGIIVEVTGTHGTLTAADFTVRMSGQEFSANNVASSWAAAPTPSVTVFSDSPVAGTDRVHLIWANGAITNRYLEVVVEGNDTEGGSNTNTGLAASDIFFYANMIAETDFAGFFIVDATDEINARGNQGLAFTPVNTYDFNKDFVVDASDQIIARTNGGAMFALAFSDPPAAPAPPAGDDDGAGSAVASALAATGSSEEDSDSGWVSESLASSSVGGGSASSVFAQLAEADSPGELTSSDGGGDELDSLLDSLLDDLGLE